MKNLTTIVELQTEAGIITGTTSADLHAAGLKKAIKIRFTLDGSRFYNYKFSPKTGKLWGATLPFEIKLIVK